MATARHKDEIWYTFLFQRVELFKEVKNAVDDLKLLHVYLTQKDDQFCTKSSFPFKRLVDL